MGKYWRACVVKINFGGLKEEKPFSFVTRDLKCLMPIFFPPPSLLTLSTPLYSPSLLSATIPAP